MFSVLPFVALAAFAGETITVHYVEVPVSVVTRDGNPVRGLTKENFQLFDGRKPVTVSSFETIDFGSPASLKANATSPAAHRSFLILFDLAYSSPSSLARAQSAARTFVQKNMSPGDLVGVATLDLQRGYKLISNFTSDRTAVAAAIERPGSFRGTDPLQIAGTASWEKRQVDEDLSAAVNGFEPGTHRGAIDAYVNQQDVARFNRTVDEQFVRQRVHQQIDWLSQLAASLRNMRGRTQIVFMSEGFNARIISGRSARDTNEENEDADLIMTRQWYKVDTDRRYGSSASLTVLQAMTQAFQGSGVVLHAIDLRGIRTEADLAHGAPDDNGEALFLLARPTGGEVFRNSNDLGDSFARMLHQQEIVYVLGFQAPVVSPGKLHELNLKLVGGPRGASLFYRKGYFEGGTASTPLERELAAADIIVRDLPESDIHIVALAAPFPGTNGTAQVPVVVDISGPDLLKSAKGNDLAAEVFVYAFDEEGKVRDRVYQRLALDVAKVGDKLRQRGVKYMATLQLPAGKYAIKTLVRTPATEQNGYVRTDVVVPKSGETVMLPPLVVDDPQAWLIVRGSDHGGGAYPFHINGQPFVPSASGHAPAGAIRKVVLFVCNAEPEELTWQTTPRATLLAQLRSEASTKLVLQLDERGPANLDLSIHKKGSAEIRRERVQLGVE